MNFWEVFGLVFWSLLFISYLFVLFAVFRDIFRDDQLNGWLKAAWIIVLIFIPVIAGLVYVITRGRGMDQRSTRRSQSKHDSHRAKAPRTGADGR
jgi:hypothetical protein